VISPVDSDADPETAEVLQGLCRHIEVSSDADAAYDTAGQHQVIAGRGYWRVLTEYVSEEPGEQDIVIRRVRNPFSVYLDPSYQAADGSDAKYGFIITDIPKDDFEAPVRQGRERLANRVCGHGTRDAVDWYPSGRVRVAEYFYTEDGKVYWRSSAPAGAGRQRGAHRGREWPGKFIPIVPVVGDESDLNGAVDYLGLYGAAETCSRWRTTGRRPSPRRLP